MNFGLIYLSFILLNTFSSMAKSFYLWPFLIRLYSLFGLSNLLINLLISALFSVLSLYLSLSKVFPFYKSCLLGYSILIVCISCQGIAWIPSSFFLICLIHLFLSHSLFYNSTDRLSRLSSLLFKWLFTLFLISSHSIRDSEPLEEMESFLLCGHYW